MTPLGADLSLSLREKFSQHWQKKQASMVANNMKLFNVWAPAFLHLVFLGAVPWAMVEVIPTFYGDNRIAMAAAEVSSLYGSGVVQSEL
ncbi:hypothetical protein PoB_003246400 [Plakobranchus ocellatus]|uniref:Uncharacterized protein n=1 Tax=Plakobranchus ocellatus TaxID=259542 RepID=A0AAV4AE75_9GAST|nr:hypothetical protein PoB_003246400 [Plakobranchus ocellatus]